MKKVLMIYGDYLFKNDISFIASTGRFFNIGQIYSSLGYDVVMASFSSKNNEYYSETKEGMKIHYLEKPKLSKLDDFLNIGVEFCEELSKLENISEFDAVIFYGTTLKFSLPIKKMADENNILTISITNEWGNFKIRQTPSYLLQKFGIKYVKNNYDGVISISQYMHSNFIKKKIKSIVIPSIFDFSKLPKPKVRTNSDKIIISYAGTIANGKDSMAVVLEALSLLEYDQIEKIQMNLYGSSRDQVIDALGEKSKEVMSKLKGSLTFKGHYEREKLREELVSSDFTILIRPDKPYANAGFPTKFAESLSLGVPVIANGTSDIAMYLETGFNGVLVKDDSLDEVIQSIKTVLSYEKDQVHNMRLNAFDTAKKSFNYQNYKDSLLKFMEELNSEKSSK